MDFEIRENGGYFGLAETQECDRKIIMCWILSKWTKMQLFTWLITKSAWKGIHLIYQYNKNSGDSHASEDKDGISKTYQISASFMFTNKLHTVNIVLVVRHSPLLLTICYSFPIY